jgi:hypothetical protein
MVREASLNRIIICAAMSIAFACHVVEEKPTVSAMSLYESVMHDDLFREFFGFQVVSRGGSAYFATILAYGVSVSVSYSEAGGVTLPPADMERLRDSISAHDIIVEKPIAEQLLQRLAKIIGFMRANGVSSIWYDRITSADSDSYYLDFTLSDTVSLRYENNGIDSSDEATYATVEKIGEGWYIFRKGPEWR